MKAKSWLILAVVLGWIGAGKQVWAEDPPPTLETLDQKIRVLERKFEIDKETAEEKKKTTAALEAGQDSLTIKSGDGNFQFRFHGLVQTDARFYLGDQRAPNTNGFLIRRARPILDATLYRDFDLYIAPDFGGGAAVLQDAYLNFHPVPQARLRIGKFKEPFGLERLQSDVNNRFIEVGLPSALVPNRDVGASIYGDVRDGIFSYAVGVFNGVPDGGSVDADTNDGKDLAARIFAQPFKSSDSEWAKGLGLGVAVTDGSQSGALPSYRSFGQATFFSYLSSATADGERLRLSPQVYYYNGPFGFLSEYVLSSQEVRKGTVIEKFTHGAWQVAGSYLITGDKAGYKGVSPLKPFDPKNGNWGAWELAARYGELDVDDAAFTRGYVNPTTSATKAAEWIVGVNWYLNRAVRFTANYGETSFTGGAARIENREKEKAILTRFQIAF